MGLLSDILKAIGVMFFGLKDHGKDYAELVESAERYLRWGQQRKDIRDYQSALENCLKCRDDYAPKPDLKLRRHTIQADTLCGLVQCETRLFQDRNGDTIEKKKKLIAEIDDIKGRMEEQKEYIRALQLDGSLIKAKEAQIRLDELVRHCDNQTEVLNSGSIDMELQQEYGGLEDTCSRHRSDFDLCLGALMALEGVDQRFKDEVSERLRLEMPLLMETVHDQSPDRH